MRYQEQVPITYEPRCPYCGKWASATVCECFTDHERKVISQPQTAKREFLLLGVALIVYALVLYITLI